MNYRKNVKCNTRVTGCAVKACSKNPHDRSCWMGDQVFFDLEFTPLWCLMVFHHSLKTNVFCFGLT